MSQNERVKWKAETKKKNEIIHIHSICCSFIFGKNTEKFAWGDELFGHFLFCHFLRPSSILSLHCALSAYHFQQCQAVCMLNACWHFTHFSIHACRCMRSLLWCQECVPAPRRRALIYYRSLFNIFHFGIQSLTLELNAWPATHSFIVPIGIFWTFVSHAIGMELMKTMVKCEQIDFALNYLIFLWIS